MCEVPSCIRTVEITHLADVEEMTDMDDGIPSWKFETLHEKDRLIPYVHIWMKCNVYYIITTNESEKERTEEREESIYLVQPDGSVQTRKAASIKTR